MSTTSNFTLPEIKIDNHADEAAAACGLCEVNFALNRHKGALDYYHHD